jgi:hypothetical protein
MGGDSLDLLRRVIDADGRSGSGKPRADRQARAATSTNKGQQPAGNAVGA